VDNEALGVDWQRLADKSEYNNFVKHDGLGEASQVCQIGDSKWDELPTDSTTLNPHNPYNQQSLTPKSRIACIITRIDDTNPNQKVNKKPAAAKDFSDAKSASMALTVVKIVIARIR